MTAGMTHLNVKFSASTQVFVIAMVILNANYDCLSFRTLFRAFSGQVAATTHVGFQVISLWGVKTKVKSVLQQRHAILFVVSVTSLQGEEHLHLVYDLDN